MENKKVFLLTGDKGFLGSHIKKRLNGNIIGLGRSSDLKIDIREKFSIDKEMKIDCVIHVAGKAHSIPNSQKEREEFYKVNYQGTINLCSSLDHLSKKPNSFIFISSVAVYGIDSGNFINESNPLLGESPYARSKILAEQWLQNWANEKGIILGILRLPLIAGVDAPGNLGTMIKGIDSGKYLSIGKAKAKKSVIWVDDVADVILKLSQVGGIYNLTDGYHPTFGELERVISESLHKSAPKKIPFWAAKLLAKVGDIAGNKFPINSSKLSQITSDLTFDDQRAKDLLSFVPNNVLNKIAENLKKNRYEHK